MTACARVRARAGAQLLADVLHVRAYRLGADRQPPGEVLRDVTLGHELENFAFPGRQHPADGTVVAFPSEGGPSLAHEQVPDHVRRDRRAAVDDLQHRLREVQEPRVLDQEARGTSGEGPADLKLVVQRRVHDDFGRTAVEPGALDQVESLAAAEPHVEDEHVELLLRQQPPGFGQAARFADDAHAGVGNQFMGDRAPHGCLRPSAAP